MARLEWERARAADRHHAAKPLPTAKINRAAGKRQDALTDFAGRHHLRCFVCHTANAEWAKSGISKRGPWIICAGCVKRQAASPTSPTAEA